MGQKTQLTPQEAKAILDALVEGDADIAFAYLATDLKANQKALSDATLRLYIEEELFECFNGRGDVFSELLDVSRG